MIQIYKGFQVKPHKQYPNNYVVVTDGKGGKIPNVLDTMFTSRGIAKEEIDRYLGNKVKDVKSAETVDQG